MRLGKKLFIFVLLFLFSIVMMPKVGAKSLRDLKAELNAAEEKYSKLILNWINS